MCLPVKEALTGKAPWAILGDHPLWYPRRVLKKQIIQRTEKACRASKAPHNPQVCKRLKPPIIRFSSLQPSRIL